MATIVNIDYADLVIPISSCPFHAPEADCPFMDFWKEPDFYKKLDVLNSLSTEEINHMKVHHQQCMCLKIEKKEGIHSY